MQSKELFNMCVIIIKPANATMTEDDLRTCFENNPDGLGYMYASEGRVVADKFVPNNFEEVKQVWDRLEKIDAIIHLRFMTTGIVNTSHCHPFRVLRKNKSHPDMFFMHNGTFKVNCGEGENDTIAFKNQILKPLLTHNPDALEDDKFIDMIEGMDGWSRMAFLTGEGKVFLTRERQWVKHGDVTLSNSYSLKEGHRNPPPTTLVPYNDPMTTKQTSNTTSRMDTRNYRWVDKLDENGNSYSVYTDVIDVAYAEVVNDISELTFMQPDVEQDEVPELMRGMGETYLLDWCKEDLDDAVATLMTQYDPQILGDFLAGMGISFNFIPLEEDVRYLIETYPEAAVDFIREDYFDLQDEFNTYYQGAINVN